MAKTVHSDHCPVLITCNATQEIPLSTIMRCAQGTLSHAHYVINKRIKPPINMSRIDPVKVIKNLEAYAVKIKDGLSDFRYNHEQ